MKFTKYHGLGNDFIILEENLNENQIKKLCDRHFGIGADGLIIHRFKDSMPYMDFYNSDGTKALMCGNGIRCYADYLKNLNIDFSKISTLAGIKNIEIVDGKYKVYMGKAEFKEYETFAKVLIGNPHCIIINDGDIEKLEKKAKEIEQNKEIFPDGVNVSFVKIKDENNIEILTHERGVGITYACGTAACASAYYLNAINKINSSVNVKLLGGFLEIQIKDNGIYMIGEATKVFEGEINI